MKPMLSRQNPASLLGLSLDGDRLEITLARLTGGALEVQKTLSVTLTLNPLKNEPELVGREIRNHLDAAGIRERRCIVGLPLDWALAIHQTLPELPEADVDSFLQIEAERGFPSGEESLLIGRSRFRSPGGEAHATQVAVPRDHVLKLESALEAAGLKPVSFTLGITALPAQAHGSADGSVILLVGEKAVHLLVTCVGGVAALRVLESTIENEGGTETLHSDGVGRELRITLGQLPADVRNSVHQIKIFGPEHFAQQLAVDIRATAKALGLGLELEKNFPPAGMGVSLPNDTAVTLSLSLLIRQLSGHRSEFEFLPPKISVWQQLSTRYSSKKLVYAGGAAGVVVLITLLAFLIQQWQLSSLKSQWKGMEATVTSLQDTQQQIRKYRPWFDESFAALNMIRHITEAFPEDGVVTAKTLEIRNLATVTCTGTARDNQAIFKTLEQLRATKEIAEVKVDNIRGKSPSLQFTFNLQWAGAHANENQ